MLKINNKTMELTEQKIYVGKYTKNGINAHNICIELRFINNNEKGYINLDAGYETDNSITSFLNKTYRGVPFENDDIYFEIFDTAKFYDTEIESEITIKVGDIEDNKVNVCIDVNDELVNVKFDGDLDLIVKL